MFGVTMCSITVNYQFVKSYYPEIAKAGSLCDTFYHLDKSSCMSKIRLLSELVIEEMAKLKAVSLRSQRNLMEKIKAAEINQLFPEVVIDDFNEIRNLGNLASHANNCSYTQQVKQSDIAKPKLKEILKKAFGAIECLFLEAGGNSKSLPEWSEPHNAKDNELFKLAVLGDAQASHEVAKSFIVKLTEQKDALKKVSKLADKKKRDNWVLSAEFFLNQAYGANNVEAAITLAEFYASELAGCADIKKVDYWFKEAIKIDTTGMALYYCANYHYKKGDVKYAISQYKKSATLEYLPAIETLVEKLPEDEMHEYIALGVDLESNKCKFADLWVTWCEHDSTNKPSEQHVKTMRAGIIELDAKGFSPVLFLKGICILSVGTYGFKEDETQAIKWLKQYLESQPKIASASSFAFAMLLESTENKFLAKIAGDAIHQIDCKMLKSRFCIRAAKAVIDELEESKQSVPSKYLPKQYFDMANKYHIQETGKPIEGLSDYYSHALKTVAGYKQSGFKVDRKKLKAKRKATRKRS
jgi:hypothetical protein